jgi:acyl-CoA synthetase (NDP forming)/RimJ/RimL family protein N-acetyltransferase
VGPATQNRVDYPQEWEADVVLKDGSTCHLRPIRPADADGLRRFHAGLSAETVYLRFFAPYPRLTDRDVERFTHVDHRDRVALVATVRGQLIGVVRFDRVDQDAAEVAFVIRDDYQGRGLGTIFLEHIAEAARERGLRRFVAEVLPENSRMLEVFRLAGYDTTATMSDGVVSFALDLEPTDTSVAVMRAREHRADARAVERLLTPRTVAVVGAGRDTGSVGHALVRHLVESGFTGRIVPVNPHAREIAGLPAVAALADAGDVDLVVVAVPAAAVPDVVEQAADAGAFGLLVVSSGFAEAGEEGARLQRELVTRARAAGLRLVGPNALGVINTAPGLLLNASLSPVMPPHGPIGFFSQSGAMGAALLETLVNRGLGLTTFFSAGNRADVSGNDLLQYWDEDDGTDVVLLYLESIGNPRKFSRIARRLAQHKPVVAVKTGRLTQGAPLGHAVRSSALPAAAVDALFEQSGVVRTDTLAQMFDVAQVLAFQPLPAGPRVLSVSNSDAMALMAADAVVANDLVAVEPSVTLAPDTTAADLEHALAGAMDDPAVDSVLVLYVPPLNDAGDEMARAVGRVAARGSKPVVAVMFAVEGVHRLLRRLSEEGVPQMGSVPTFAAVEDAVRALAEVTRYARWRARPGGTVADLDDVDAERAAALVDARLADVLDHDASVPLDELDAAALLGCYGIDLVRSHPVASVDAALVAADLAQYPVVLKSANRSLRLRSDLGGIWFDLQGPEDLRRAYLEAGRDHVGPLSVQHQAAPGVSVTLASVEDPLFGPVVSFGVSGIATELLGDRTYRIPPLRDYDIEDLLLGVRAAPLLCGHAGAEPVDLGALRQLVARLGRLAEDVPEVTQLELRPVVVSPSGLAVLGAQIRLGPAVNRPDGPARSLLRSLPR